MKIMSGLLRKLMIKEKEILNGHKVRNSSLIGSMYEGLTKGLIEKIYMSHHDIKVVSGVITSGEIQSGQIDCMVVIGEGDRIPNTDNFFYSIDKVIAVFEVKKNLLSSGIKDAYHHLEDFFQLSKKYYKEKQKAGTLNFNAERAADEFFNLFGKYPPHFDKINQLSFEQQIVYQSLVRDFLTPLRIVIGYNGFKSENALRKSIFKIYQGKELVPGYGVSNMPNLIISDGYSLVKMNGMPYKGFWDDEDGWAWIGSSDENPLLLIMELLFDRIFSMLHVVPNIEDNLNEELLFPLVLSKPVEECSRKGWRIKIISDPIPERKVSDKLWSPLKLSFEQYEFLKFMWTYGPLKNDSDLLDKYKSNCGVDDVLSIAELLINARVVLVADEYFKISCGEWCVAEISGGFYCGNNMGNVFFNWLRINSDPAKEVRVYVFNDKEELLVWNY